MNNNGRKYSMFSIFGLCISIISPFFIFSNSSLAYPGIVMPFVSLVLSIVGIIDTHKNKKNGALLSVLGIVFSILLIIFVVNVSSWLINARLNE